MVEDGLGGTGGGLVNSWDEVGLGCGGCWRGVPLRELLVEREGVWPGGFGGGGGGGPVGDVGYADCGTDGGGGGGAGDEV